MAVNKEGQKLRNQKFTSKAVQKPNKKKRQPYKRTKVNGETNDE